MIVVAVCQKRFNIGPRTSLLLLHRREGPALLPTPPAGATVSDRLERGRGLVVESQSVSQSDRRSRRNVRLIVSLFIACLLCFLSARLSSF